MATTTDFSSNLNSIVNNSGGISAGLLEANKNIPAGQAGSPWTLASSVPTTPNTGTPQTVPVVTADKASQDLATKQATYNNLQQGMTAQAQNNAVTSANQDANKQQSQQMTSALDVEKAKADALNNATNALSPTTTTPTTTTPAETQAGFTYKDIQNQLDEATTTFNNSLAQLNNGSFPLTPAQQAQLNATKQTYANIASQIQSSFKSTLAGTNVLNVRLGLDQYAPKTALDNIQSVMDDMQTKISNNEATAAKAMADLQAGFQKDDYTQINDAYTRLTASLDKKTSLLNTLNDQINKQATLALEQHKSNMADLKQETDRRKDVIDFAVKNNITKPAYLVGNTAFNSATGEPLSYAEFLALTGQDPNTPQEQADFSALQTDIKTPEERTLEQGQNQFDTNQKYLRDKMAQDQTQFEQTYSLDERKTIAAEQAANSVKKNLVKVNGTDYLVDDQGNLTIPKTPSTASAANLLSTTQQSLHDLQDMVNNDKGFTGAVGAKGLSSFFGLKGSPIAGTAAANFDGKLKQTVNDVVLPNLTILHGLGRVTEREFQALQSSITSLSTNLSEDEFKTELNKIIERVDAQVKAADSDTSSTGSSKVIEYQGQQYNVDADGNLTPLTNEGSGSANAQVKAYSAKTPLMKPIEFNQKEYTPIQKQNLAYAPDVQVPKVTIGAGAAVKNNNPGNLRNTDGSWQHFSTPEEGFKGLMGYLARAVAGKHSAYNPAQSLYQFFSHYAPSSDNNDPKGYAESVARKLGVSANTKISQLDIFAWAKAIAQHESNTKVA